MLELIFSILLFLLIINVIAFVHEFGHFYPAIKSGVKVSEFGFGYPPRIFGIYKKAGKLKIVWGSKDVESDSTIFSINLLPLGAFNNINSSRDRGEEAKGDKDDFDNKKLVNRFAIILGGIISNFILGVVIFYFILAHNGFIFYQSMPFDYKFPYGQKETLPLVVQVEPFSPASVAGLKTGDMVLQGEQEEFHSIDDFTQFLSKYKNKMVDIKITNIVDNQERIVKIMPDGRRPQEKGLIGVGLSRVTKLDYRDKKWLSGIIHSVNFIDYNFSALGMLFSKAFKENNPNLITQNVVGPVGIAAMVKTVAPAGPWKLLELTALISLIIGCMNLLPLPAFDGGRLMFLIYEAISRKKASLELEHKVNGYGFAVLVIIGILVIIKDLFQFKDLFLSK
ncbi:site-2 protease family protein [Candidatus Parcubacteria bacterium]|nr:site-2 protease family protein [Candidatus Parcubacteria bacterium]